MERIKALEEDLGVKEDVIKKLETELETAKDAVSVATAEAASLEDEKATLKTQVDFFRRISKVQKDDIIKMQAGAINPELDRKLKNSDDELKSKGKSIEALEKSKKELVKKLEEEVRARAKAEADSSMFSKMVEILQQTQGTRNEPQDKSKVKCRDVGKTEGCPRAGSCPYLHPELAKENKNVDCHHWMSGKCRYSEAHCRFKHDPAKKDTKASKRKRSEESQPAKDTTQQDFLLGLVKALTQGPAGEARLGEAARGMEGKRTSRPRMGSPCSSARGMEGQQWFNRSYANVTNNSSPSGREEQERNYYSHGSPARGMEGQGLMERMRGLVETPKSAYRVDPMQEGIQLLMQISAQQAGKR